MKITTYLRQLTLLMLLAVSLQVSGQKKLVPATVSVVSGLQLPGGTKTDLRALSVSAAKAMFSMEIKNSGLKINSTEVLYLPLTAQAEFTAEKLSAVFQQEGWSVTPLPTNQKYLQLQKDNRTLLAYVSTELKQVELYFAECEGNIVSNYPVNTPSTMADNQQTNTPPVTSPPNSSNEQQNQPVIINNSGFAFTTTNFDDGWKSEAKEDWVEVTKGSVTVLLHYPRQGTIIPADPEPFISNAWNILVAPRYRDLKNYKTAYITEYERPYLGFGDATDAATGREVFVLLFRKGRNDFVECITPDKNSFVQNFGFDPYQIGWDSESSLMNTLVKMPGYNRFAIAASDLTGTWTSDFSGMQQLYSVYTGQYAGMNINQSSQTFEFGAGNTYNWKILAVNGMVGSMKYGQAKSSGTFNMVNNWQISFSDIEGKPRLYNAYFSCIKGGRMFWINDAQNPGSGIPTGFGKK